MPDESDCHREVTVCDWCQAVWTNTQIAWKVTQLHGFVILLYYSNLSYYYIDAASVTTLMCCKTR